MVMPISDLVQEFLKLEDSLSVEKDVEKVKDIQERLLVLITEIQELRPLQDPALIIARYRP
jgi:hypothetical protein